MIMPLTISVKISILPFSYWKNSRWANLNCNIMFDFGAKCKVKMEQSPKINGWNCYNMQVKKMEVFVIWIPVLACQIQPAKYIAKPLSCQTLQDHGSLSNPIQSPFYIKATIMNIQGTTPDGQSIMLWILPWNAATF